MEPSESRDTNTTLPEDHDLDEIQREVTAFKNLYQILHTTVFNHKKTEGKDIGILNKLVTDETRATFRCVDIGKNMEKSCFSIVLTDMNDLSRLIAHASFTDIPTDPNITVNGKRWRKRNELAKATSSNTLFMSVFLCREDEAMETCVAEIIANTFCACDSVEFIIMECPDVDFAGEGFMFSPLVTTVTFKVKSDATSKLIIYAKEFLLPKLKVRQGRELDLDDLMPLLNIDHKELQEIFRKKFLVDLVSMSDGKNATYVAEFDGFAVGLIAISAEVNYKMLNEQFHLEPFHGLYKPYSQDEVNVRPIQSCLLGPARSSEIHIRDTFKENERDEAARSENPSLTDTTDLNARRSVHTVDSDDDLAGGDDFDIVDSFIKHVDARANPQTQIDYGDFAAAQHNQQRFFLTPYRLDSKASKVFQELEGEGREELRENVEKIINQLEEDGKTLGTALLDSHAIRILTEAQAFINHCIHRYLHKTVIDDRLLPLTNLNDPPPSVFLGFPNAVALQLITLDKKYHVRINNLINGAFSAFPTRDYLLVTTPSGAPELPWMKYFVRVTPKATALFPKTLYLMHRACFSNTIRVRRAKEEDLKQVASLVESLYEGDKILWDFKISFCIDRNTKRFESYVADITTHSGVPIIGLAIIGQEENVTGYQINYELDQYTYVELHDPLTDHAYVYHFIMTPIFQPHSKIMMKEIMRLSGRDCFYHKIFPISVNCKELRNQTLLNNLDDFTPLVPRRRIEYSLLNLTGIYDELRQPPKEAQPTGIPFMAFHHSKKFTYEVKTVISKRVVFVGASDTNLACLERMLGSPYFDFKNLTLISTHGLPGCLPTDEIRNLFFPRKYGPAISMKNNEEWHQRLPIRSTVNVVYGTVSRILRKIKVVVVGEGRVVPYDILVVATGRQFIRPDMPVADVLDERLNTFKQNLIKGGEEMPARPQHPPKPKNVFLINTETDAAQALNLLRTFIPFVCNRQVIIHGACLEAYCTLRALVQLGITPQRITFVTTEAEEMEWEAYHCYRDTAVLRKLMMETIEQLGIEVLANYEFLRWGMDAETKICNRIYFSTTTDIGEDRPAKLSVPCVAYFPFLLRRVSDEIVIAIASTYLPYSNGILINTRFETADPSIMAAGPCAAYNKKLCAEKFDHYHYTSYEVGHLLGDLIMERVVPPTKSINFRRLGPSYPPFPPTLRTPLIQCADLPGGWYYLHVSPPGVVPHCCRQTECTCRTCVCATEIITGSLKRAEDPEQKYFRIRLDKYSRVDTIECISRQKFPTSCISYLFGHHVSFLNKLMERLRKREVTDMYQHFCQPWIGALAMDRWPSFREEIKQLLSTYDITTNNIRITDFVRDYLNNLENPEVFKVNPNIFRHIFENTNLKAAMESKFLNFLKYNKASIPMYARPDFVEDTYLERLQSPLYIPLHKNFGL